MTFKLALFALLSVLSEDTPGGLPERHIEKFKKLGNELQHETDIDFDKVIEELITIGKIDL